MSLLLAYKYVPYRICTKLRLLCSSPPLKILNEWLVTLFFYIIIDLVSTYEQKKCSYYAILFFLYNSETYLTSLYSIFSSYSISPFIDIMLKNCACFCLQKHSVKINIRWWFLYLLSVPRIINEKSETGFKWRRNYVIFL